MTDRHVEPVKCICGSDAIPRQSIGGWFVMCGGVSWCWTGPVKKDRASAIMAWNDMMGDTQCRIGYLIRENARLISDISKLKTEMEKLHAELVTLEDDRKSSTYKISACYFPDSGEAELTYERMEDGAYIMLTVPVSDEDGERLAEVIGPCVYYDAVEKKNPNNRMEDK